LPARRWPFGEALAPEAAEEARRLLASSTEAKSAIDEPAVLSLLGAGLLHSGWSTDLTLLSTPCFVVKRREK
jgi:hypothetical protein